MNNDDLMHKIRHSTILENGIQTNLYEVLQNEDIRHCLLYTSPSPRD